MDRLKILIGRHNGIGDLLMAVPFIATYRDLGHDVTLACAYPRHAWMSWLFPDVKIVDPWIAHRSPYTDFDEEADGYDIYLNLNHTEMADSVSATFKAASINQQLVYAFLATRKKLPMPTRGLSPSEYISFPVRRGEETLLFAQSTHSTRSLPDALVDKIRRRRPDIVINPPGTMIELSERVARAKLVIGTDSGGVHLAEAFRTPWRVLNTTFDFDSRYSFYKYGDRTTSLQANIACSPCSWHSGCGQPVCTGAFDVDAILAPLGEGGPPAAALPEAPVGAARRWLPWMGRGESRS